MPQSAIDQRYVAAKEIAKKAGVLAQEYFDAFDTLIIDQKGHQDLVSEGDRNVELLVRAEIAKKFPDDGIVGEEHAPVDGTSGFIWVIDPIDGTANFVRGIPVWAVVIAVVKDDETVIGVTHDPVHSEMTHAKRGGGAFINGSAISVTPDAKLTHGSVGVGFSNRTHNAAILNLVGAIAGTGGVFHRNASGAVSLAYVAAGKLLGYSEPHMNAWDCLAGQLQITEAGGIVERQSAKDMIADGGRVIVGAPGIFDDLLQLSETAFG